MQPSIVIKRPGKADISLVITHPRGLVKDPDANRAGYGVAFISADCARRIYDSMEVSNPTKLQFLIDNLGPAGSFELPLIAREHEGDRFIVRNDAHVLAALVAAGVEDIPVVVSHEDARLVQEL